MTGKLSSPDESSEALHVCTMAMEAVVVLFNHEVCRCSVGWGASLCGSQDLLFLAPPLAVRLCLQVCLNPLASKEQRQLHDMPPVAEVRCCSVTRGSRPGSCCRTKGIRTARCNSRDVQAVPMARALLELLPGMASIAMIAHRVLRLMAAAGEPSWALCVALLNPCFAGHHSWGRLPDCQPGPSCADSCHAESGRQALRRAVVAVHAAATGVELPAGQLGAIAVAQAAQWVANR